MPDKVRRQVLNAMPVSYALHRIILDGAGHPCDYEFLEANKAFEASTGLLISEIVGKKVTEVLPDIREDKFDWIKTYGEVALTGRSLNFEQYSGPLKKWYKINAYSPEKGYFVTLVNEITKEKELTLGLEESNRILADFLNSSSDYICLKDKNLRHVFANKALADFLGTTPEEIIGKDDTEVYPREVANICSVLDAEVLNTGLRCSSEEIVFGRNFDVMKFPVHYPDGSIGVGAYIKDISERRKKEEYLKMRIDRQNILVDVFWRNFKDRQELLDYTLHRALELTGSQYGYIYLYDEEKREFTLNSWSAGVMPACHVTDKQTKYPLDETGIWGEIVRQHKPIVVNDMNTPNPLRKGFPKGHVELTNFMSIPITVEDKIVAVAGLGNKASAYTDIDVNEMIILMQSTWLAVEKASAQMQTVTEREKYQSILNELPALVCEFLPDWSLTFANRAYCSFFGITPDTLAKRKFLDLFANEERDTVRRNHLSLSPQNRTNDYELELVIGGEKRWHSLRDIGIFDEQGKPLRYCSVGFDITDQKASSQEREQLLAQMDAMFSGHEAVMLLIDPATGRIIDANPSASVFYGYTREELLDLRIQDINQLSAEDVALYRQMILEKEQKHFTFPHRLKNGEIRMVDVYSSPISYNDRTVLFSIMFDVTKREEAFKEIVYISYHDYLTGAYNRRFFEEEFERLNTEENFPIAVLMGDVNGLKLINDSFGHHEGDNLIKDATNKIAECLRPGDILARIGGDEFGVILPRTGEEEAANMVLKIKQSTERESFDKESGKYLLSISFGYAIQEFVNSGLGKLMKEAEGYMYNKKYYDSRSIKGKTIEIIMKTLFAKSPRDKMHSERVGNISAAISEALGFDKERINKIRVAGWLHDIGKIGIPENLLNKKGKLDLLEWTVMKTHPEKSWRILENTFEFSEISNIVLYHHEKWDGTGYPKGLKGSEIPLESRIISVADAYDAMTYNRSYRKKISPPEAIKELKRCSGAHFDPEVVRVFVEQVLTNERDFFSKNDSETNSIFD